MAVETGASPWGVSLSLLSEVKSLYLTTFVPGQIYSYDYHYINHESDSGAKSTDAIDYTHYYRMHYEGRDSYLETVVSGSSTNINFKASTSASQYDAWGKRLAVREQTPLPSNMGTMEDRVRYFTYDGEGGILRRREGGLNSSSVFAQSADQASRDMLYAFANRQLVGKQTRGGKLDVATLQGMEMESCYSSERLAHGCENF